MPRTATRNLAWKDLFSMETLQRTGRIFYALALAGVGIHQLFYADFCPFLFPQWPNPVPGYSALACVFNILLIAAALAIMLNRQGRLIAFLLGGVLLCMLFFGQVSFEFIVIPYKKTHLGLWILPLKELALAGGAFCIAGSFKRSVNDWLSAAAIIRLLEKIIPFGRFLFCITMISFGISHFLYTETVAAMVPSYLPGRYFWTYFAAVALIAGGTGIVINVLLKPAALLMGVMIFAWFIFLHIPDAVTNPLIGGGNEITAAFSALAFSGIAFVIAACAPYPNFKTIFNEKNTKR